MNPEPFDPALLRAQFPALSLTQGGQPVVFFDNPGGTQVPQSVIDAVSDYYRTANANVGGAFETSRRTDAIVAEARRAMADFLHAPGPECIVFGASMTQLAFHLARSVAATISPGDEIVVTNLDHDANVTPWTDLEASGAIVKVVDIGDDCALDPDAVAAALSPRTKLVAITHASNAVGVVPDVAAIVKLAHAVGAWVFVDAVQFAPHGPLDVCALDCDFLACSAYKFFGPHVGILYGKAERLQTLTPHKVRPSKDTIPHRWETGTLNHEGLAGVTAAVNYLAQMGTGETRREKLTAAMGRIREYEKTLSAHLLDGLKSLEDVTIYGAQSVEHRIPTVAFTWPRLGPRATAERLAASGIAVWSGNYYALNLMERLGLEADGGAVRVGLTHYNTLGEIDRLIEVLRGV